MTILLVMGSIIIPVAMFFLHKYFLKMRFIFNSLAIISLLVFGNIASLSIYQIIKDNTVLMTNIHAVFLNNYFLVTGAYLAIYILYQLLLKTEDGVKV